jgi:hypothetical protein
LALPLFLDTGSAAQDGLMEPNIFLLVASLLMAITMWLAFQDHTGRGDRL